MIKIQKKDFSIEKQISILKNKSKNIGAVSNFIGYVSNDNFGKKVNYIFLEVYKNMANNKLEKITIMAKKKWEIIDCLIIHRYGKIRIGEKIVMVAVISEHREESFKACKFIMNYLKKEAPFWKKEIYNKKSTWLKN